MAGASKTFPFPPDLLAIAEALDQCEADARAIVRGLTDDQVNWRPSPHSWTIAQCLDHLAKTNSAYTAAMHQGLAAALEKLHAGDRRWERKGEIQPGWVAGWFLRQLEPPVKLRFPAATQVQPAERLESADVLERFMRSHEAVRGLLREGRTLDLNRVRFRNPLNSLFRWSVGTGLLVVPAHDRRHLWQMSQIRAAAGFPAAAVTIE